MMLRLKSANRNRLHQHSVLYNITVQDSVDMLLINIDGCVDMYNYIVLSYVVVFSWSLLIVQ